MASDRRQSFRCAVPEETAQAVLRIGESSLDLQLVNTSAGGYSAICGKPIPARLGDLVSMGTASGWVEVRIVHIDQQGLETALGLERVRELKGPPQRSWTQRVGGRRRIAMVASALAVGLLLGALIAPRLTADRPAAPRTPDHGAEKKPPTSEPLAARQP